MTLKIDSLQAEPGQKCSGFCKVDIGSTILSLPVVLVNGAEPGARLTITAGVHHAEYTGVEALLNFIDLLDPARIKGQIVACPLSNPPGFFRYRKNIPPVDEVNPNRVFPGNSQGNSVERMVAWLFDHLIASADAYIDLHCGCFNEEMVLWTAYRTTGDVALDRRSIALAEAFNLPYILCGGAPTGGNSHAAATRAGIPSILVEAGSNGLRSAADIILIQEGLMRVSHHLGINPDANIQAAPSFTHWVWAAEYSAPMEGLWFPAFKMGDEVTEGSVLGRITDPLGNLLSLVKSPATGRVIFGEVGLPVIEGAILAGIARQVNKP